MAQIDAWDRLVIMVKAKSIHSVQIKVMDVDRKDFWDQVKEILAPVLQSLLGIAKTAGTAAIPKPLAFLTGAFGTAVEDVESYTLKKLANGKDKLLYKGTVGSLPTAVGTHAAAITGIGTSGTYAIGLKLKIT